MAAGRNYAPLGTVILYVSIADFPVCRSSIVLDFATEDSDVSFFVEFEQGTSGLLHV